MPGTIAAAKSFGSDCSATIEYTASITEGGIRMPSVPAAATEPAAKPAS